MRVCALDSVVVGLRERERLLERNRSACGGKFFPSADAARFFRSLGFFYHQIVLSLWPPLHIRAWFWQTVLLTCCGEEAGGLNCKELWEKSPEHGQKVSCL